MEQEFAHLELGNEEQYILLADMADFKALKQPHDGNDSAELVQQMRASCRVATLHRAHKRGCALDITIDKYFLFEGGRKASRTEKQLT